MTVAALDQLRPPCSKSPLVELDDAVLVEKAKEGDECAFEVLVVRHRSRLRGTAYSIVTGADLDDVIQRAWLKIFRKLHTLREPRLFAAWASRVTVNTALAYVRKRGRRSETNLDDLSPGQMPADDSPDAAEKSGWQALLRKTRQWFEELEPRDQMLFRHYLVDGMTMEEIGVAVGMSPGGVKTRLFRARKLLRARRDRLLDGLD